MAVRKIYFTVVLCVHIIVLYLSQMKQFFTNLLLFHLQTKASELHPYEHSWSPNDGDRNKKNDYITFGLVSFITYAFMLLKNPIHQYNIFPLARFFFRQI